MFEVNMEFTHDLVNETRRDSDETGEIGNVTGGGVPFLISWGDSARWREKERKARTKLSRKLSMHTEVLAIPCEEHYEGRHLDGLPEPNAVHKQHWLLFKGVFDHLQDADQLVPAQHKGHPVRRVSKPL